jgi:hypothetical protein
VIFERLVDWAPAGFRISDACSDFCVIQSLVITAKTCDGGQDAGVSLSAGFRVDQSFRYLVSREDDRLLSQITSDC